MTEKEIRKNIRKRLRKNTDYLEEVMKDACMLSGITSDEYINWEWGWNGTDIKEYLYKKEVLSAAVSIVLKKHGVSILVPRAVSKYTLDQVLELVQEEKGEDDLTQGMYEIYMEYQLESPFDLDIMEVMGCEIVYFGSDEEDIEDTLKSGVPKTIGRVVRNMLNELYEDYTYFDGIYMLRVKGFVRTKAEIQNLDNMSIRNKLEKYMKAIDTRLQYLYAVTVCDNVVPYKGAACYIYMFFGDDQYFDIERSFFCSDGIFYMYAFLCIEEYIKMYKKGAVMFRNE